MLVRGLLCEGLVCNVINPSTLQNMRQKLLSETNIWLLQAEVVSLILEKGKCKGVILKDGSQLFSQTVVITTGTFMNGIMHVGEQQEAGGRVGEKATNGLSTQFSRTRF